MSYANIVAFRTLSALAGRWPPWLTVMSVWRLRWLRLGVFGLGAGVLCVVIAVSGGVPRAWFEDLRLLPFFLAMALLPALGLPMTPFYVLAGMRFGVTGGLAIAFVATLLNLLLCYEIGHGRLRSTLQGWIQRRFPALLNYENDRRGAWRLTLLVKLVPGVPMFVKHYSLGVAGVPRSIYLTVALMTTGPYATAFVILGESALEGNVGQALIAVSVLALIAVSLLVWRRYRIGRVNHR